MNRASILVYSSAVMLLGPACRTGDAVPSAGTTSSAADGSTGPSATTTASADVESSVGADGPIDTSEGTTTASSTTGSTGTSESGAEPPACDLDAVPLTFTRSVYPAMVRSGCTARACHDADASTSGDLDAAYAYLLDDTQGAPLVVPGASADSPLVGYFADFASAPLTTVADEDVARVSDWIDAGAVLGDEPASVCDLGEPLSYAELVAPIFTAAGCSSSVQCHAPGGIYPEITHAGLVNTAGVVDAGWTIVVPGDVDESSLAWHLVTNALPAHIIDKPQIAVVDTWIRTGALP